MDKNFVIGTVMVVVMAAAILSVTETATVPEDNSISAMYHTAVCVYKNGELTGPCESNNVTNTGLNWVRDRLFGVLGSGGTATAISLGNNSNAELISGDFLNSTTERQAISGCGLAPATGTAAIVGTGNASVTYLWTSACNNIIVNTTALSNATANASTTMMFAGKNFTAVTLQSGDQLNITWYVWVTNVP